MPHSLVESMAPKVFSVKLKVGPITGSIYSLEVNRATRSAYFWTFISCLHHRASLESAGPQNSCNHLNDKWQSAASVKLMCACMLATSMHCGCQLAVDCHLMHSSGHKNYSAPKKERALLRSSMGQWFFFRKCYHETSRAEQLFYDIPNPRT